MNASPDYPRDLVGYGRNPPHANWLHYRMAQNEALSRAQQRKMLRDRSQKVYKKQESRRNSTAN